MRCKKLLNQRLMRFVATPPLTSHASLSVLSHTPLGAKEMVVLVVMGVCGSGKTTVGRALASEIGCKFADADDWHPETNVEKMRNGIPLNDQDRYPWLKSLSQLLQEWEERREPELQDREESDRDKSGRRSSHEGVVRGVLACSALKRSYREILSDRVKCVFVVLNGEEEVIRKRMESRYEEHFMPPGLLQSQFEALELPTGSEGIGVIYITDISSPVREIVTDVLHNLNDTTKPDTVRT